jgi:hypothetical protein
MKSGSQVCRTVVSEMEIDRSELVDHFSNLLLRFEFSIPWRPKFIRLERRIRQT